MKVVFKEDAASNPDDWTYLDRIVYRIEDGAHEWAIENVDAFSDCAWLKNSRATLQKLFEEAVKRDAYPQAFPHLHSISVSTKPNSGLSIELTPKQAAEYVQKPLYVLVENRFTDGQLLATALDVLSPEPLKTLHNNKTRNLIYCDGPGGNGELLKLIEQYLNLAKDASIPARMVIFSDSDGKFPGDIANKPKEIEAFCIRHSIPCLILSKRAIENYIPDEVFSRGVTEPARIKQVKALLRLNEDQRDHFPIKSGIQDFANLTPDEQALYTSVGLQDKRDLKQGLGTKVIELLKDHPPSHEELQRRDHKNELGALISKIMSRL